MKHGNRVNIPGKVRAQVFLRQDGLCADCGAKLVDAATQYDHRPPLGLRAPGDDPNDPARIFALCKPCHAGRTFGTPSKPLSGDIQIIAKTKRQGSKEAEHRAFMIQKQCGQKRPRKGSIRSRGFS